MTTKPDQVLSTTGAAPPSHGPDYLMATQLDKVLYTAHAHTIGGREGQSKSDDGRLDITLSAPGSTATGTNPEQLFAAGYSACFIGAIKAVAGKTSTKLPDGLAASQRLKTPICPNKAGGRFTLGGKNPNA